jgi:hypothetical protein
MIVYGTISFSLLSGIWDALRDPVRPLQSLRTKEALESCARKARRDGGRPLERYVNEAVFLALRSGAFTTGSHREFLSLLLPPGRGESDSGPLADPLSRLAAVCIKPETMGFETDSALFLRLNRPRFDAPESPLTLLFKQRLASHIRFAASENGHRRLRTLRTKRGFIIQARLDAAQEPQLLDIYGPRYKHARDWMDVLGAEEACTIEFRDAAGYNPSSAPPASGLV